MALKQRKNFQLCSLLVINRTFGETECELLCQTLFDVKFVPFNKQLMKLTRVQETGRNQSSDTTCEDVSVTEDTLSPERIR